MQEKGFRDGRVGMPGGGAGESKRGEQERKTVAAEGAAQPSCSLEGVAPCSSSLALFLSCSTSHASTHANDACEHACEAGI